MLGSAQSVTPKPAAMPPATPPAQPGAASAGGPSFAHFLNDQPDTQPAHTDPVPSAPDTAKESTAASNAAQARRKESNAAPPKPAAPAQGRAPEAPATTKPAGDTQACDDGSEPADATSDADDDAQTSGLNEFTQLIGLAVPAPQTAQPAAAAATADTGTGTDAGRTIRGARAGRAAGEARDDAAGGEEVARDTGNAAPNERRPTDTAARASDTPRAKGIELAADKAAAVRSARSDALQAAATTPAVAAVPRAAAAPDALPNSFAAVLAQAQPTVGAAPGATPTAASARVNAALHSNAFAPELGARVSLMAVGGVQQAELQLNPADMGPVSVQIVVDGAQAQVSFHAAQAETRQALQQSLPDLAAALQGQGLTLAGGGVFQQASQHAKDGDAQAGGAEDRSSSGRGGLRVEGSAAAAAPPARRAVGLLDTFA